jgi:outer membrane immunogenic protein
MRNKLIAATVAALIGMGGAAFAGLKDGPYKDGPVYVPETSWTGFYVGAGIGGGFVNHDLKLSDYYGEIADLNGIGGQGVIGTVEVGYDRQVGRIVGGIFFNYDFSDVGSKLRAGGGSIKADLDSTWSAGGRLGYLVNPNTLIYALAAYTEANFDLPAGVKNPTFAGYSVGGGFETKLGGSWFLKAEYRFSQFDTETLFADPYFKLTDSVDIQTVRLVLSYKADLFERDYIPLK